MACTLPWRAGTSLCRCLRSDTGVTRMRVIEGRSYYTIGEMASAIGVSRQTLRVWERKGFLSPVRSQGGQRLYTRADLFAANRLELVRGRRGWDPTRTRTPNTLEPAREAWESLSLGMRIRAARRARQLSLVDAAARIGISRSFLGSIERGEADASANAMSRIADALHMPQSAFSAPREPTAVHIVRANERPRTQLDQGVRWEELSAPGQLLEPALEGRAPGVVPALTVPPSERPGQAGSAVFHSPSRCERRSALAGRKTHSGAYGVRQLFGSLR